MQNSRLILRTPVREESLKVNLSVARITFSSSIVRYTGLFLPIVHGPSSQIMPFCIIRVFAEHNEAFVKITVLLTYTIWWFFVQSNNESRSVWVYRLATQTCPGSTPSQCLNTFHCLLWQHMLQCKGWEPSCKNKWCHMD